MSQKSNKNDKGENIVSNLREAAHYSWIIVFALGHTRKCELWIVDTLSRFLPFVGRLAFFSNRQRQ